jgi:hypothetical protein
MTNKLIAASIGALLAISPALADDHHHAGQGGH